MKIVVDTNIIFSALIGPDGTISDLIFNSHGILNFFSPESIEVELQRHRSKLAHYLILDCGRNTSLGTVQPLVSKNRQRDSSISVSPMCTCRPALSSAC